MPLQYGKRGRPVPWKGKNMQQERWEALQGDLHLLTSREHTFGTDAFLLARFAGAKRRDRAADFGTGCGIIPFLWYRDGSLPFPCFAVDIQPQAIEQCRRSIERAGLEGEIVPLSADIRSLAGIEPASLTLITCNPPYKVSGGGILSKAQSDKIARHETLCTLSDICKTASRLLQFGGRLCLCQRPERLCDLVCAMRENGIEPKRMQFVHKDAASAPWLVLVEGRRGGKPFLNVEPPFLMTKHGVPTQAAQALYRPEHRMEVE